MGFVAILLLFIGMTYFYYRNIVAEEYITILNSKNTEQVNSLYKCDKAVRELQRQLANRGFKGVSF